MTSLGFDSGYLGPGFTMGSTEADTGKESSTSLSCEWVCIEAYLE